MRYLAADAPLTFLTRYVPSRLDPFLPYLKQRVAQGCTNTRQLWQEIRQQGYSGSSRQVDKWLRLQRRKRTADTGDQVDPQPVSNDIWPAPRTSAHVLLVAPEQLNPADSYLLSVLTRDARLKALYEHAQQFIAMLRRRDAQPCDNWIRVGRSITLRSYHHFVQSIEQDRDAVLAAIILPWSNGQTEGQIHRLKLLKRQMYGRAKLDLLRIRLMLPPSEHHICV